MKKRIACAVLMVTFAFVSVFAMSQVNADALSLQAQKTYAAKAKSCSHSWQTKYVSVDKNCHREVKVCRKCGKKKVNTSTSRHLWDSASKKTVKIGKTKFHVYSHRCTKCGYVEKWNDRVKG